MIGDDDSVRWDEAEGSRLENALNESDVVGVRLKPSGHANVLLHVLSLPPSGPLPKDPRRVLRLTVRLAGSVRR